MVPVSTSLSLSCTQLYELGETDTGYLTETNCNQVQLEAFEPCGCSLVMADAINKEEEVVLSSRNTTTTTPPAVAPIHNQEQDEDTSDFVCHICGIGFHVTNWLGVVPFPDSETNLSCTQLQDIATTQSEDATPIDEIQCEELMLLAFEPCGWQPVIPQDGTMIDPTQPPEEATSSPPGGCYTDLDAIALREETLTAVDVFSSIRTYVLCPNTIYVMGSQTSEGGFGPIRPRSNSYYKCGQDGSSTNSCILQGGDFPILSTMSSFDSNDYEVTNVIFQGLTIQNSQRSAGVFDKPGDITFIDCIFRVSPFLVRRSCFSDERVFLSPFEPHILTSGVSLTRHWICFQNQQNLGTILVIFGNERNSSLRRLTSMTHQHRDEKDQEQEEGYNYTTDSVSSQASSSLKRIGTKVKGESSSIQFVDQSKSRPTRSNRRRIKSDKTDKSKSKKDDESSQPSQQPSNKPSLSPSLLPSSSPSSNPTQDPTQIPSSVPSTNPSVAPSSLPTNLRSNAPTKSILPTISPSDPPSTTTAPSHLPTFSPTSSLVPTVSPSTSPTISSNEPTNSPSSRTPTVLPSSFPSQFPSYFPSEIPSSSPSVTSNAGDKTNFAENPPSAPPEESALTPSVLPTTQEASQTPTSSTTMAIPPNYQTARTAIPTAMPSLRSDNNVTSIQPTRSPASQATSTLTITFQRTIFEVS